MVHGAIRAGAVSAGPQAAAAAIPDPRQYLPGCFLWMVCRAYETAAAVSGASSRLSQLLLPAGTIPVCSDGLVFATCRTGPNTARSAPAVADGLYGRYGGHPDQQAYAMVSGADR